MSTRHTYLVCGSVTTKSAGSKLKTSDSFSHQCSLHYEYHHYWFKSPSLKHGNHSFILPTSFLLSINYVLTILLTTHSSDPIHSSLSSSLVRHHHPSPEQLHFPFLYLHNCNLIISIL